MLKGSRKSFFNVEVMIDDLKEVGNLEVTRQRFIGLRMIGWKKEARSLKTVSGNRSKEQEDKDFMMVMGEKREEKMKGE